MPSRVDERATSDERRELGETKAEPNHRRRWPTSTSARMTMGKLGLVLAFLVFWQLATGRLIADYLISNPVDIAGRIKDLISDGSVWPDFWATAVEFFFGYLIGIALGLVVGVALGMWPTVGKLLESFISALNGIPKIALAPLIILWLGIDTASKIGIAVMTVFFVMFYNTYIGMRTVPPQLVNALRVIGASKLTVMLRVVLPQMSMPILAGLRAGIPFAIIGVIVGEFVASTKGLGHYIRVSSDAYDATGIFAGIALLMVLIGLMNGLVSLWERRVTRWQRRTRGH